MHAILKQEHEELVALNQEFAQSQTLTIEEFERRRVAIELKFEALANEALIVPPVAVVAGTSPPLYKALASEVAIEVANFCKAFAAKKTAPLKAKIAELEKTGGRFAIPIYDDGKMVGSQTMTAVDLVKEVSALRAGKSNGDASQIPYGGVWSEQKECRANLFYTHQGSLWFCAVNTRDKPGSSPAFVLACKKGDADRMRQ